MALFNRKKREAVTDVTGDVNMSEKSLSYSQLIEYLADESSPAISFGSALDAYTHNPYIYASVNLIANAISGIPVYAALPDMSPVGNARLERFLASPAPGVTYAAFMRELVQILLIGGVAYIRVYRQGRNVAIAAIRPDWVTEYGYASYYTVQDASGNTEEVPGEDLWQVTYNAVGSVNASPLAASVYQAQQLVAGAKWNSALMNNGAKPSWLIVSQANLTPDQVAAMREAIGNSYAGATNAGKVMLLSGTFSHIQQTSLSPNDLDFIEGTNQAARAVANAFGVPSQLVGIMGDTTYANYAEARQAFYTDTVVPRTNALLAQLSEVVLALFGDYRVIADWDNVAALQESQDSKYNRAIAAYTAGLLTLGEARELVGYEPLTGMPEGEE